MGKQDLCENVLEDYKRMQLAMGGMNGNLGTRKSATLGEWQESTVGEELAQASLSRETLGGVKTLSKAFKEGDVSVTYRERSCVVTGKRSVTLFCNVA